MNKHDRRTIEGFFEIERCEVVSDDTDAGHQSRRLCQRRLALIGDETGAAPAQGRLIDRDLVTTGDQLACNATQKMGIAVIPARDDGLAEDDDFHHPMVRPLMTASAGVTVARGSSRLR